MRVLVVSNKCPPDYDGGYELSAFQVAAALRTRGYDVRLVASRFRDSFQGERADPDWVDRFFEYREFDPLEGKGIVRAWRNAKRIARMTDIGRVNAEHLAKYLEEHAFDLAYCFGLQGIGLATAHSLKEANIPILWHAGNYLIADDLQLRSLFSRHRLAPRIGVHLLARKAFRMILDGDYRNVAFLSEHVRERFRRQGVVPERSFIIPRGVDFPLADEQPTERTVPSVFLFAARIAEEKGVMVALQAAQLLHKESPEVEWQLHLAGPGRPETLDSVRSAIHGRNLEPRVQLLGMLPRDEVLQRMRSATAFLSTSVWEEPFGRTNIEALGCGAPLIAADTGAIREIVGDANCAILYPKHDPQALANAMKTMLIDDKFRETLVERGVARIREAYTLDRILGQTEAAFGEVLGGNS